MAKIILVPTDFSRESRNAFNYALGLSKKLKSKIVLLNVFSVPIISPDVPLIIIEEQTNAMREASLRKLADMAKKQKVKVDILCKQGLVVDSVLKTSETLNADLIVMGTKGASGLKEVFVGSNTSRLAEKANCPVLAVPAGAKFAGLKNISCASEYHHADATMIRSLANIAKNFNSRLSVIHVINKFSDPEHEANKMEKFIRKVRTRTRYKRIKYLFIKGDNILMTFDKYMRKEKPAVFVMSTHHRDLFDKVFGASYTKRMVCHTKIPLMVYHYA